MLTTKLLPNTPTHTLYIMGNPYQVPAGFTIMTSLEYVGFQWTRGCGCRGGVCGGCATIYRVDDAPKWQVGLACQTLTQDNMHLVTVPYVPSHWPRYVADNVTSVENTLETLFPHLESCLHCNSCTQSCPLGLKVLGYVRALQKKDFEKVRKLSMECILCGMCALRCPKNLAPQSMARIARRLLARIEYKQWAESTDTTGFAEKVQMATVRAWEEEIQRYKNLSNEALLEKYKEFQESKGDGV